MPKIITPAMRAHLDAETTRLAAIWRITRKDGQRFLFTDHDRDIVFGGDTYRADAGFERTAIRSDAGFAVDNLDLVGVFAEGGIVEDEVRAGLFDGAEIAISFVNWQDPDGLGEIWLRRGTLGETRLTPQGYFHAELRGLSQPLAQSTLEVFSPNCRADLGDERCAFPIQRTAHVHRSNRLHPGQHDLPRAGHGARPHRWRDLGQRREAAGHHLGVRRRDRLRQRPGAHQLAGRVLGLRHRL
jgi:hypothetical protein